MPDIFETIMHRRSIRRFEPKQIEETALQQILQLKQKFYQAYPNSNVLFSYRIAPLTAQMAGVEPQKARHARRKPTKTIRTTKKKGE